jgi:GntR family transcriptional repressor for pyruvate dehydrogenase complex
VAFHPVTTTRSYEQVVRQIADEIRSGRLGRGERLPTERELGANFGVSRGVVREAVKVLDAMGLVEPRQGSGLYVRANPLPMVTRAFTLSVAPEEESVAHLFELRRLLEVDAARLAAARRSDAQAADLVAAAEATAQRGDGTGFDEADQTFHRRLYEAAANPYLTVAAAAVRGMQADVAALFSTLAGSTTVAAGHHRAIAAAVNAGDAAAAAAAMAEHIAYTADAVAAALRDNPAYRDRAGRDPVRGAE